ncbi:MAG: outer membrane protein transport protein [Polyangia bacterium]
MRRSHRAALASVLLLSSALAHAHSNGTVFSSPVDGDSAALYWNPAAMALSTTSRVDIVANFNILEASYQRFGTDTAQTNRPFPKVSLITSRPEPNVGFIIDRLWHERLRIGLNITVPSAAGAMWPRTVTQDGEKILGPTRYHVTDALVFTVYATVGASLVVHRTLSLGLALNVAVERVDVHKDVDFANQPALRDIVACTENLTGCENPALSAPIHLSGTGVSAGASMGVLWMPTPRVRIGAAYSTPAKVQMPLRLSIDPAALAAFAQQFLPGYTPVALNGRGHTSVTVPQRAQLAIAGDVHPSIELMAMLQWVNNSATEVVSGVVTTRSATLLPAALSIPSVRNDTFMFIARVVGRIRDRGRVGLSIEYSNKGVPSAYMTPANLDFDNVVVNLGGRLRLSDKMWLGATYAETIAIGRTVTASAYGNSAPVPYNLPDPSGRYTGSGQRVGLDLSATF